MSQLRHCVSVGVFCSASAWKKLIKRHDSNSTLTRVPSNLYEKLFYELYHISEKKYLEETKKGCVCVSASLYDMFLYYKDTDEAIEPPKRGRKKPSSVVNRFGICAELSKMLPSITCLHHCINVYDDPDLYINLEKRYPDVPLRFEGCIYDLAKALDRGYCPTCVSHNKSLVNKSSTISPPCEEHDVSINNCPEVSYSQLLERSYRDGK